MNNIEKNLAGCFTEALRDVNIVYVTMDPLHATGVHDLLPNYRIVCPFESEFSRLLKKEGVNVFVLESEFGLSEALKAIRRGSYGLLSSQAVLELFANTQGLYLMTFKNSLVLQKFAEIKNLKMMAPQAGVSNIFEEKISQYRMLKEYVPFPEACVVTMSQVFDLNNDFPFYLQFNRGHTGSGTLRVNSKQDIAVLAERFPERDVKIVREIKGETYTLNGFVANDGSVFHGSISLQLTGLLEATDNLAATVGNDFSFPREKLDEQTVECIHTVFIKTGEVMHAAGYVGMYGIDVIVEEKSRKVYFIEVNARQQASVSFEARLHRAIERVPIIGAYILDYFDAFNEDLKQTMPPLIYPNNARQVIYRSRVKRTITRDEVVVPELDNILMQRKYHIPYGEEIYRVQDF